MKRYHLTVAASLDLQEILDYLLSQSPDAAVRVYGEIEEAMNTLAQWPLTGHQRDDLTDKPLRFHSVYSYMIVYRPDSHPLEIVRVFHGARNVRRMLENE